MSNEELMQEAKNGNKAAVELLIRNTYQDVFVFIHWKTRDYHLAWDIAQETYLKMLNSIHTYDPSLGSFKPWLIRIAINTINDYFRSRSFRQRKAQGELGPEEPASGASGDLLEKVLIREEMRQLMQSLDRLPEPQRDAILLKFVQGMKFKEIGAALGIIESTAKSRVRLGLMKLKEEMSGIEKGSSGGGKNEQPRSKGKYGKTG